MQYIFKIYSHYDVKKGTGSVCDLSKQNEIKWNESKRIKNKP